MTLWFMQLFGDAELIHAGMFPIFLSMKSIRIAHTIYLMLGVALLVGGAFSVYMMQRCDAINAQYTAVIHGEIAQAQQARVIQVNFKKQVQAWKDILLRGKDDAALTKYDAEFHRLSTQVQSDGAALEGRIGDAGVRADLEMFLQQHRQLNEQYEQALGGYKTSRDFAQADTAVKGKDRPPTDRLDGVVQSLNVLAESVPAEVAARQHREQGVLIVVLVVLWFAVGLWCITFARSLGKRLEKSVQYVREIANGDLTAADPECGHHDELGLLVEAMNEMREHLLQMVCSVQTVADTLSQNAQQAAASSHRIAGAVADQRGQSGQVASALEEMIASVREVTQHCSEAAQRAVHTGDLAGESRNTVEAVAGDVREIAAESHHNAVHVKELGERSSRIGQIVTLIEEIAGQTNLLALNAAIESARAGEHGRGFAVVAGEVRRLAERTTIATKEIAEAVHSIQQGTQDAVGSIEKSSQRVGQSVSTAEAAAHSLQVLGESADEVRHRISQIAQAAEEQSQSSGLLGQSMNEISASIGATADGAEDAARIAGELVKLAQLLTEQSRKFNTGNCAS
jgi:methyl-accepting chemotaxis protein